MSSNQAAENLQNQWYNTLKTAVGGNGNFQMIQPNNPIPPQATNDQIWQYFNNLPPVSLNHNLTLSGGNQFYTDYAAVLSQLQSNALTNFQNVLGSYYPMWQQYLAGLNPFPSLQDLPNVFYQWAVVNAPSVAGPGRSAYSAALLDPIFAAQTAALNTNNFVNSVPNFTQGVTQLFQQIPAGGPVTINFDSSTASSNVTNTWAKGNTGIFFGIFGESDKSTSELSQQFASSRVAGTISFQKLITFVADPPGLPTGWYSSAALHQAYAANTGGAPWMQGANPNWESTFGPNGNMQWFTASLVVADGVTVQMTSYAKYSSTQQTQIKQSSSTGLWPFYWKSGSSSFSQTITFNSDSTMTYTQSSAPGNPLIIGAFVLPASQYLGGNQQMAAFVMPPRKR
ncbi:MAG: hypothetical protein HRF40_01140 [Nitrososphaera sp.]|jgi:hypothetical protein